MNDTTLDTQHLSRRHLLKVGLLGTALLSTAGLTATLSGYAEAAPAQGYLLLRRNDLPFLRALIPVILADAVSAEQMVQALDATLHSLDSSLAHLSPEIAQRIMQLFDLLAMPISRGPLTGVWGDWSNASAAEVGNFLHRWQDSRLDMLRMGHAALLKLVLMAWYARPEAWALCGYPGPPAV
ncbi:Twin-arginine translocation pathway signal protein [Pseudomonas sp. 8Z]|uniref:twin-arginine translocation pathway signal protein n=1 Tax=Pseudomonas sp. 8Z TaxID=2653166 RepID=UPI0012F1CAD7|nr:twin-arginine translocation pathway signal protein [Pseudomonas sp. 8Z]VXC96827.1 Twin-arginine translocation pathway signal protein [Pseudomonas sp. 8Z]